jgi:hypothetical protein
VDQGLEVVVIERASSLASQLPQFFAVNPETVNNLNSCGSWLASDEASTGN